MKKRFYTALAAMVCSISAVASYMASADLSHSGNQLLLENIEALSDGIELPEVVITPDYNQPGNYGFRGPYCIWVNCQLGQGVCVEGEIVN